MGFSGCVDVDLHSAFAGACDPHRTTAMAALELFVFTGACLAPSAGFVGQSPIALSL
jgi:hypothetical protein